MSVTERIDSIKEKIDELQKHQHKWHHVTSSTRFGVVTIALECKCGSTSEMQRNIDELCENYIIKNREDVNEEVVIKHDVQTERLFDLENELEHLIDENEYEEESEPEDD